MELCRDPVREVRIVSQSQLLVDREVLFFGGKGGVGKTTLAAAFAVLAAEQGARTLLVSTDPAHSTSDIFEMSLGPEPHSVGQYLWALEIDPAREVDDYIAGVKERVAEATTPRLLEEVERQIDIARVSPGAEEAALFDRFARIIEDPGERYDRIVFDTAPTGQTLRLLSLPELMTAWISGLIARRRKVHVLGRMWRNVSGSGARGADSGSDRVLRVLEERKQRFEQARRVMTDSDRTAFVFVVVAERLPLLETRKAVDTLDKHGIPIGAVIVNKVLPESAEGAFVARRREHERKYLGRIGEAFAAYRLYRVPLLEGDIAGMRALRTLVSHLPAAERRVPSPPNHRASSANQP